jgi:hypothetical protein
VSDNAASVPELPPVEVEVTFTASNLPEFNGFEIKVIMTGTNQSYAPRLRDFRAIAFA